MKTNTLTLFGATFLLIIASLNVKAIPAFARKTGVACSGCHTAVPSLNAFGRKFKTNGYRVAAGQLPARKFNDYLNLDKSFPIAAAFSSVPYDKAKNGETKVAAIGELELFIAGSFGKNWSGFLEFAGGPGEAAGVDHGQISYAVSPKLNLQIAWGPTFWSDPYDTLTHMRRITISKSSIIGSEFGGADGPVGENRSYISANGYLTDKLYYSVGFGSQIDNAAGTDPQTITGRVAFDFTPNIMLGAFTVNGTCTVVSGSDFCLMADRDYTRSGIDFQADVNNWRFTGVYMKATDDNEMATASESNKAMTGRVLYTVQQGGRPVWVPYLQIDKHEMFNGSESITDTSFGLIYYFEENIKGTLEYVDTAGSVSFPDDARTTFELSAYF